MFRYSGVVLTLSLAGVNAQAAGGTGEYDLDWPVRGERLAYHSCGCADACWVAEVRSRQSRAVTSRLRCDCQKLYFWLPGRAEQVVAEDCSATNNQHKPEAIGEHMLRLRMAGRARGRK